MTDTKKQRSAHTGEASGVKQGVEPFHVRVFRAHSQLAGVRSLLTALERAVWSVHQDISDEGGSLSGEQQLIKIIDKKIADVMDLLLPGETAPEDQLLMAARTLKTLELLEEIALGPYEDSDCRSLCETYAARAQALLAKARGEDGETA